MTPHASTTPLTAPPRLGAPELALIAVTFIWGGTFLIVHNAVAVSGPLAFVGLRFTVAALFGCLVAHKQLRGMTRAELRAGAVIGLSIFAGYTLQTYGLQTISSSKSAFITAFYVPLVPLFQWAFLRHSPHPMAWAAVVVAFFGLALLAGPDGLQGGFGIGESLTALGALAIGAEIILISRVARQLNAMRVTIVQLAVASLCAYAFMPITGEQVPPLSATFLLSAVGLGGASALIQFVMNWAQKRISATKATLIYAGEPVWAGIVGRIAGDRMPALAVLGAVLIVCASVLSEWRPKWLRGATGATRG
jgi:drug/metabolite transporter (DMT)-like permease